MEKMYRIFISSTFQDLQDERKEVLQALLGIDCIPTGMEMFQASDENQWNLIKRVIDSCDYYIVIVGKRYGSIHPQTGKSYTQMEYEYALENGIPILGFIYKDIQKVQLCEIDNPIKLQEFIDLVQKKVVRYWTSPQDLAKNILLSLHKVLITHPRPGWIKCETLQSNLSHIISNNTDKINTNTKSQQAKHFRDTIKYSENDSFRYWYSQQKEFINILFGGGITAISNFLDKKLKVDSYETLIYNGKTIPYDLTSNCRHVSCTISCPIPCKIILSIDNRFWNKFSKSIFLMSDEYIDLPEDSMEFLNSALKELGSMFAGYILTQLSDMIHTTIKIDSIEILSLLFLKRDNIAFVGLEKFSFEDYHFVGTFFTSISSMNLLLNPKVNLTSNL